jgi:hypothetical protein
MVRGGLVVARVCFGGGPMMIQQFEFGLKRRNSNSKSDLRIFKN